MLVTIVVVKCAAVGLVFRINCVFSCARPLRRTFLSTYLGLGINESPLHNIEVSAFDRV